MDSIKWSIVNVVASVMLIDETHPPLGIEVIANAMGGRYSSGGFSGAVIRGDDCTFLLFRSGRAIATGLKKTTKDEIRPTLLALCKRIRDSGFQTLDEPMFNIVNVVANGGFGGAIDLNEAAIQLDNIMYEPEVFPGMVFRDSDPKAVFLLFANGSFVCTGAKSEASITTAIEKTYANLSRLDLISTPTSNTPAGLITTGNTPGEEPDRSGSRGAGCGKVGGDLGIHGKVNVKINQRGR